MSPSSLGWITVAILGPIGAVLLMKYRRPVESDQVQRFPRATSYAYLLGGLIFILLGVVLPRKSSEWWTEMVQVLFRL